ncbi:MAG: carbohydrate binding family 9 domain-containing protein [Pseudomonadota bacterium]
MRFIAVVTACLFIVMTMTSAFAQPPVFSTYTPAIEAARITRDAAPVIDGDLSDPAWSDATAITDFYQVEPQEGPPSQKTKALIMYNERTLFVGIYAYDTEPEKIQRSQMERDPRLQEDDAVRVLIDPFGTFRDSFFFGLNPNGARSDALTENGNNFRDEWNTIWRAKARIVDDGWIAEFAIPFQSISFDPSLDQWGLQIIRTIRRNNEEIRWSNINRSRGRIDMTNPGLISGIENVTSGIGLEGQLFVAGGVSRDHELQETSLTLDPSANIFYKVTPSLTGSLTFNTDFADAPLDSRQVNTGRFSLFFPETRDFFLQDSASFEFGGLLFRRSPNGLPFFSRNIGIVDGGPVDIIAGAKVSGKSGLFNIGAISARTGATEEFDGQTLSAVRVSANVLRESKVGLIATHGDPTGETRNTVAGVDFQYRNSTLIGAGQFIIDAAYLRSIEDNVSDQYGGLTVDFTDDLWGFNFRGEHIGENYSPQLGFSNRTGIRRYRGSFRKSYRPGQSFVRKINTGVFGNIVTDLDDEQLDRFIGVFADAESNDGDEAGVEYRNGFLDIREPFDLAGEIPIPIGEYRFNEVEIFAETSDARPLAVGAELEVGGAFGGSFTSVEGSVVLKPNRFFRFEGNYEFTDFDLPGGRLGVHIASIEKTIAFTPDMTLRTEIQYDNISEALSVFSRFSWEPRPTREMFVSLAHGALIQRENFPQSYRSQATGGSIRLGYTFRR